MCFPLLKKQKMRKPVIAAMFFAVFSFVGCDTEVHEAAAPPPAVDVIDHGPDAPLKEHLERSEARRENVSEVADDVDVKSGG